MTTEPIADPATRLEAARMGMWIFLATEVLFFGSLILGYTVYLFAYPQGFRIGSEHTKLALGTLNTAILLTSSFCVALAVHGAHHQRRVGTLLFLSLTTLLAFCFLGVKGIEYSQEIHEKLLPNFRWGYFATDASSVNLFYTFYWIMTGLHALHVLIGVGLFTGLILRIYFQKQVGALSSSVEIVGLYWHFVDIVWVFLYPLIYLIGRAHV